MSRAKPEDDEYWNSSKFKAFTFDDDDDEFSRLKESKRAVNSILVDDEEEEEEEDGVERVSWSGEPVGSVQSFPYSLLLSLLSILHLDALHDTAVRTYAPELRKPKSDGKVTHINHCSNIWEILFRELMARDVALRHYVHYLKEMGEQKLLVELMKALGRTEDMALMQYKEQLNIKDEGQRRDFLKSCLGLPFSQDDATHVQDHYTLLERHIIIEADAEIFKKFPRKASILNMPIITTLYYSCFYHYGESEGTYSSPANIRKTFRISEKQYILTALGARAKLKSWFDVDSLFNTKNWLGYTKKRSPVGFHRVVDILQKNSAPVNVLQEYVNLIDSPELKLSVALKYKCHDIVINTYRDLKDRQELVVYREKLERDSPEYRKIQELLNNVQIRWKN
uniref:Spermatogenesis-defective protein 39 homolog n=1 Tax=Cyprinus carpio TaxID=7962 RepID=A0A8C1WX97_CYPCA